jgi:hypothetical protein
VAPPVFKTGLFSQSAKMANETVGCFALRQTADRSFQGNSGHKNVYSAHRIALPL